MRFRLPALLLALPLALHAQQPATPATAIGSEAVPTLRTSSQIVIVDLTVQDKQGHPVHGLDPSKILLTESNQPQTIRHFEEHTPATTKPGPAMPPLPPGTFTNYTQTPEGGALNILLVDSLNTPLSDQTYLRAQLDEFARKAHPGQRIAIFGLSQRLFLLQGFSSDPAVLRDSIEHKLIQRKSVLLNRDDVDGDNPIDNISDQMLLSSSALAQFRATNDITRYQLRLQYTLDAFNALAHYLQAFPGRKNLIWFSGSFPINILPDGTVADPFAMLSLNEDEFRDTTNLLVRSQVAVYPVDARGLMTNPAFSASQSGSSFTRNPANFTNQIAAFSQAQANEHMTMDQLADETGGQAFYNNNDLAGAVTAAINNGSNYYTLTYSPTNKNWDGNYRTIRIKLAPELASAGYKLAYRQGYYAFNPTEPTPKKKKNAERPVSAITADTSSNTQNQEDAFVGSAMQHGAPTPQDILFKVRVLPASTLEHERPASGNQLDPVRPVKGPFRDMLLDYAIPGTEFDISKSPEGRYTGKIEFTAMLYDNDGKLLNVLGQTVMLNLTPESYEGFRKVLRGRFVVSVPVKSANSFLRIGIRDVVANHFGAVEIPVANVIHLAPPPDAPKSADARSAPEAPATNQPATPSSSTPTASAPTH